MLICAVAPNQAIHEQRLHSPVKYVVPSTVMNDVFAPLLQKALVEREPSNQLVPPNVIYKGSETKKPRNVVTWDGKHVVDSHGYLISYNVLNHLYSSSFQRMDEDVKKVRDSGIDNMEMRKDPRLNLERHEDLREGYHFPCENRPLWPPQVFEADYHNNLQALSLIHI